MSERPYDEVLTDLRAITEERDDLARVADGARADLAAERASTEPLRLRVGELERAVVAIYRAGFDSERRRIALAALPQNDDGMSGRNIAESSERNA